DVNCAYGADEAVDMARALADQDLDFIEEPVWPADDFAAIRRVRAEGLKVALGENAASSGELETLVESGTADIVQPSVIKLGGITEMMRLFARVPADAILPHAFYWG